MLHTLSQELMILGFLSFSLVMSNEYNAPWIPNPDWFHALECGAPLSRPARCRPLTPLARRLALTRGRAAADYGQRTSCCSTRRAG